MGAATPVAKKKVRKVANVEIRTEQEWIDRVDVEASRLGVSRSAYIRMAVNEKLDRTDAERRRDGVAN
jgi:predicted DNA binding CopG/RHH family protein